MCKEVFYISPFNSELTAAIIGQSLAPAILAGTWGVIGAAFLQNNEVHRDAASAFQHPDTKPRWEVFDNLKTHFCCDVHSPVLAETHSCSSPGKSCSSPHRHGEWTEQAVTYYLAPLLWGRRTGPYLAQPGQRRKKVLHVALHALSVSFWPKTYHHWITAACSLVPGSCRGIGKSVPASLPSPAWTDEARHSCPSKQ